MISCLACRGLKNALASYAKSFDRRPCVCGGFLDGSEGKGSEFSFVLEDVRMGSSSFDGRSVQLAATDYVVPVPAQVRVSEGVCLARLRFLGADRGNHGLYAVEEKDHGDWEVPLVRCQGKDAMVAVTVTDAQDRIPSRRDDGLARCLCLCLYHAVNLEASAYPGFCDVWRHWRFSTGLSTRDSYEIQPCNLLQRHQVRKGVWGGREAREQKGEPICKLADGSRDGSEGELVEPKTLGSRDEGPR